MRKLDFLLAVYNRPRALRHILETGLAAGIPGASFVVFDDASDTAEDVPGLGSATVETVCRSFADPRVIYVRNPANIGVAKSIERYYREIAGAEYVSLQNPKDEFIDGAPILAALAKLDADPAISLVVYPLRQTDRENADKPMLFHLSRMSGRDFVATHVRDPILPHCASYAIIRASAARKAGIPRNLDLRALGLEDGSGIDHDMLFRVATTGDADFVDRPPLRRSIVDGYTERFPLTFGYTQYQYARRLMAELAPSGFVSRETKRLYLCFWLRMIARGWFLASLPPASIIHERGTQRLRGHLKMPLFVYVPLECMRQRILPDRALVRAYLKALVYSAAFSLPRPLVRGIRAARRRLHLSSEQTGSIGSPG